MAKKLRKNSKRVKAIEREDGSVVRDLSDIDLDAEIDALAREVRAPLGLADVSEQPGVIARLVALVKQPKVYIPAGLVGGYFLWRWWKRRSSTAPVGYTSDRAARARAALNTARRELQEQQVAVASSGQAEAEAAAAVAEAEAQIEAQMNAGATEPQEGQEPEQYVNTALLS